MMRFFFKKVNGFLIEAKKTFNDISTHIYVIIHTHTHIYVKLLYMNRV